MTSPPKPLRNAERSAYRPNRKGQPLQYAGQDIERRARVGASYTTSHYAQDVGREYRWNALGYRGPEFDPEADYRIYVFGESHAFGFFVEAEECWPAQFVTLWCEHHGLTPDQVCYQNFSDVGAGNAAIARTLISQCTAAPPDLVLVHFGEHRRDEIFLDGIPHRIGPWLLDEETVLAAPESGPLRDLHFKQIEKAGHFFDYATDGEPDIWGPFSLEQNVTCLEDTLRQILLVQYFCESRGIAAVGTSDRADVLFLDQVRQHAHLGPLVDQIDPNFLDPLRIWDAEGGKAADYGHVDAARHRRFARARFKKYLEDSSAGDAASPADRATGTLADGERHRTTEQVRAFYDQMPFNHWSSAAEAAERVREPDGLAAYPDLEKLIARSKKNDRRVIECGCGGGWLSVTLAAHFGYQVVGVDFSASAIERARALAAELDVADRTHFVLQDLLELEDSHVGGAADLVVSLGVLHHTADAHAALERVAAVVRPGGHLYLGLYHQPGRDPFLEHFRRLALSAGQEAAFEAFRQLQGGWHGDEQHARSWFRDQVLHPHESRHTLRQVTEWLEPLGFSLMSTSINRFAPFNDPEPLFSRELEYAETSRQALAEGRFFPGFFTALVRKS